MRRISLPLLLALLAGSALHGQEKDVPKHDRPYFMPAAERDRIRALVRKEAWAKAEHARLRTAAGKGEGYAAAFLYALDGDAKHAPVAQKYLLDRYGPKSYWIEQASKRLNDGKFFKGGQPGIPEVYYDTDLTGIVAFDWAYNGLDAAQRKTIEDGIVTWARYKMRCMDRWTQTPNLVFKPTCTVAVAGLATRNKELIDWGFHRVKPHGGALGGYFEVLNAMLKDGGPWHEAPIYPGAHTGLLMVSQVSRWRSLYDGTDWFRTPVAKGGSPRGLMDYYIDSAYPIERTGNGPGQVRVANYGDGSTNAMGDLILANPAAAEGNIVLHDALIAAYNASGDPRYAPFVAMIPGYKPNLIDQRSLPAKLELPPAPSKVWPTYGLAMLRSDESSAYWTSGKAIAVFQLLSQGYGHDHRDKFGIALHGAGRLFYPNYNAIQYENAAIGWTRNSVSHNTLVVDEGETRNATPTAIRQDFTPDMKFLATSASGVFEGVDQTRALLLSKEYLLDLFHATSAVPHTYDYLLHSFGKAQPARADDFKPSQALQRRYWLVDNQRALTTAEPWSLDFVIKEEPGSRKGSYGKEWYDHKAQLRLTMAAEPKTLVVHGSWGDELARLVGERQKGAKLDRLAMVAARRTGVRDTIFVAAHEPRAGDALPQVTRVVKLGQTKNTVVVRVEARDFTDYAAVALGPQKDGAEHTVLISGKPLHLFGFRSYGWLRVARDGSVIARGGWARLHLPGAKGPLTLNGKETKTVVKDGALKLGEVPAVFVARPPEDVPESPLEVNIAPAVARLFDRDQRTMTFTLKNPTKEAVSARLEFEFPPGLSAQPAQMQPTTFKPGESATVKVNLTASNPGPGRHTVPYRVIYRMPKSTEDVRSAALPLVVMVGATLEHVYQHPRPYFRIEAPKYTTRMDMFQGLCRHLADDDDTLRLEDSPLFTFSDGKTELFSEATKHAFTWPRESPAHLTAHAYDKCRWQALYLPDRILIRMDAGWTQFEKTHFTVPGKWCAPEGAPTWKRIVALDAAGKEVEAKPGAAVKVVAAELEFPKAKWNLAFKFEPPQEVSFNGTELKFT
jgi:hypothetical protein